MLNLDNVILLVRAPWLKPNREAFKVDLAQANALFRPQPQGEEESVEVLNYQDIQPLITALNDPQITKKEFLKTAAETTLTLENLILALGKNLDLANQRHHRNFLYWTLTGFGKYFKKELKEDSKIFLPFAKKLATYLLASEDNANDFFKNVPNILDILSPNALRELCLRSAHVAKNCLQRPEIRAVLQADADWIWKLYAKYYNNDETIANYIKSMKANQGSSKAAKKPATNFLDQFSNQLIIKLNEISPLAEKVDSDRITEMFAWADTEDKFNDTFDQILKFKKNELLSHPIFTELADYVPPENPQLIPNRGKFNCHHFIYKESMFAAKAWTPIKHPKHEKHHVLTKHPKFAEKLYGKGNHLADLIRAKGEGVDLLKLLKSQDAWFARGASKEEAGADLLKIAAAVEEVSKDNNVALLNFWDYRQPKFKSATVYHTFKKDDSHLEKLKTKVLAVAANWTDAQTTPQEKDNVISVIKSNRYRRWMDFDVKDVQKLIDTQNSDIISAIAGDASLMEKLSKANLGENPFVKAGQTIAQGIVKQRSFFRTLRDAVVSYFSWNSTNPRSDIQAYVHEIATEGGKQSQQIYLQAQSYLEKYLTVSLTKGFFGTPQDDNSICTELNKLLLISPVFALVIAKNPNLLAYLKRPATGRDNASQLKTDIKRKIMNAEDQPFTTLTEVALADPAYIVQFDVTDFPPDHAIHDQVLAEATDEELLQLIQKEEIQNSFSWINAILAKPGILEQLSSNVCCALVRKYSYKHLIINTLSWKMTNRLVLGVDTLEELATIIPQYVQLNHAILKGLWCRENRPNWYETFKQLKINTLEINFKWFFENLGLEFFLEQFNDQGEYFDSQNPDNGNKVIAKFFDELDDDSFQAFYAGITAKKVGVFSDNIVLKFTTNGIKKFAKIESVTFYEKLSTSEELMSKFFEAALVVPPEQAENFTKAVSYWLEQEDFGVRRKDLRNTFANNIQWITPKLVPLYLSRIDRHTKPITADEITMLFFDGDTLKLGFEEEFRKFLNDPNNPNIIIQIYNDESFNDAKLSVINQYISGALQFTEAQCQQLNPIGFKRFAQYQAEKLYSVVVKSKQLMRKFVQSEPTIPATWATNLDFIAMLDKAINSDSDSIVALCNNEKIDDAVFLALDTTDWLNQYPIFKNFLLINSFTEIGLARFAKLNIDQFIEKAVGNFKDLKKSANNFNTLNAILKQFSASKTYEKNVLFSDVTFIKDDEEFIARFRIILSLYFLDKIAQLLFLIINKYREDQYLSEHVTPKLLLQLLRESRIPQESVTPDFLDITLAKVARLMTVDDLVKLSKLSDLPIIENLLLNYPNVINNLTDEVSQKFYQDHEAEFYSNVPVNNELYLLKFKFLVDHITIPSERTDEFVTVVKGNAYFNLDGSIASLKQIDSAYEKISKLEIFSRDLYFSNPDKFVSRRDLGLFGGIGTEKDNFEDPKSIINFINCYLDIKLNSHESAVEFFALYKQTFLERKTAASDIPKIKSMASKMFLQLLRDGKLDQEALEQHKELLNEHLALQHPNITDKDLETLWAIDANVFTEALVTKLFNIYNENDVRLNILNLRITEQLRYDLLKLKDWNRYGFNSFLKLNAEKFSEHLSTQPQSKHSQNLLSRIFDFGIDPTIEGQFEFLKQTFTEKYQNNSEQFLELIKQQATIPAFLVKEFSEIFKEFLKNDAFLNKLDPQYFSYAVRVMDSKLPAEQTFLQSNLFKELITPILRSLRITQLNPELLRTVFTVPELKQIVLDAKLFNNPGDQKAVLAVEPIKNLIEGDDALRAKFGLPVGWDSEEDNSAEEKIFGI